MTPTDARRAVDLVATDVKNRLREVCENTGNPVNVHYFDHPQTTVFSGGAVVVGEINHDSEPFVTYDGYEYLDHLNDLLEHEGLEFIVSEGNSYVLIVEAA